MQAEFSLNVVNEGTILLTCTTRNLGCRQRTRGGRHALQARQDRKPKRRDAGCWQSLSAKRCVNAKSVDSSVIGKYFLQHRADMSALFLPLL